MSAMPEPCILAVLGKNKSLAKIDPTAAVEHVRSVFGPLTIRLLNSEDIDTGDHTLPSAAASYRFF